jgi:hypothetical protein
MRRRFSALDEPSLWSRMTGLGGIALSSSGIMKTDRSPRRRIFRCIFFMRIGNRDTLTGCSETKSAVHATANWKRNEPRKIFCPGGSAQPLQKAHFGQENPRKSKLFSLILFGQAWPGLAGF